MLNCAFSNRLVQACSLNRRTIRSTTAPSIGAHPMTRQSCPITLLCGAFLLATILAVASPSLAIAQGTLRPEVFLQAELGEGVRCRSTDFCIWGGSVFVRDDGLVILRFRPDRQVSVQLSKRDIERLKELLSRIDYVRLRRFYAQYSEGIVTLSIQEAATRSWFQTTTTWGSDDEQEPPELQALITEVLRIATINHRP